MLMELGFFRKENGVIQMNFILKAKFLSAGPNPKDKGQFDKGWASPPT